MSYPMLPPNPSLVAIILMIKTRAGIHHVFHYPPNPGQENQHIKLDYENSSEEESSESSEEDGHSSFEDDRHDNQEGDRSIRSRDEPDVDESGSASPEKEGLDGWKRPESTLDGFLGLPGGIQHFLCPDASAHKKRFEISIDGRVFVGWPIFSREDGSWKRKKKPRRTVEDTTDAGVSAGEVNEPNNERAQTTSMQLNEDLVETTENETGAEELETVAFGQHTANADTTKVQPRQDSRNIEVTVQNLKEVLNMFHVVFVMNPPPLEYQVRVDEMYSHIVKKFSRALKWEQSRSDFVRKEAEKIRELTAKHRSSHEIIRHSHLATAIATLYTSISTSRIAHITLSPSLTFSLQIPIPVSISVLPSLTDPQTPGLWLTTATSIPPSTPLSTQPRNLASHFALLLLSDLPSILADIAATHSPLIGPLTHYLRHSTPTKSILQVSQSSSIPLADIQFLAAHLIYWRRARSIPPLHHRDTYIVSPNADMRKLKSACAQYAKLFPALPSLPKVLSLLSAGGPRPFAALVPSKDHKEAYLGILAWLLRGGWVTQLRTFAWVRVPVRVQEAVAREMELEATAAKQAANETEAGPPSPPYPPTSNPGASTAPATADHDNHDTDPDPQLHPSPSSTSFSSTLTAIALSSPRRPILITHPTKASGLESRYLTTMAAELAQTQPHATSDAGAHTPKNASAEARDGQQRSGPESHARHAAGGTKDGPGEGREAGEDAKEAWQSCLKYFNGEHALEKIAVREGWKRKRVEGLRAVWRERGFLVEVRGW